jgi:hypothetical protein
MMPTAATRCIDVGVATSHSSGVRRPGGAAGGARMACSQPAWPSSSRGAPRQVGQRLDESGLRGRPEYGRRGAATHRTAIRRASGWTARSWTLTETRESCLAPTARPSRARQQPGREPHQGGAGAAPHWERVEGLLLHEHRHVASFPSGVGDSHSHDGPDPAHDQRQGACA